MIQLERSDKKFLKLSIIRSNRTQIELDEDKVHDLIEKEPVYEEDKSGISVLKYWKVPREELGEIYHKFHGRNILSDQKTKKDYKLYCRLLQPIETSERIKPSRKRYGKHRLYPHQHSYVTAAADKRRTLNCFSTGQGKTKASLARAETLGFTKMFIVTIEGAIDQWQADIRELFNVEPLVYVGNIAKREKLREEIAVSEPQFVITTYGVGPELWDVFFDAYICDEAHLFHNESTLLHRRFRKLFNSSWKNKATFQALTASPMGNWPSEMWALIRLVHPLLAGAKETFRARYERVEETTKDLVHVKVAGGEYRTFYKRRATKKRLQNCEALKKLLSAAMVIAEEDELVDNDGEKLKKYVSKPKYVNTSLTEYQAQLYNQISEDLAPEINGKKFKIGKVRTKLLRLLQVLEGAYNIDPSAKHESGKLLRLRRELKALPPGTKAIAWFRFKPGTKIAHKMFKNRSVIYNGDLNRSQKRLAKWAFAGLPDESFRAEYDKLAEKYGCTFEPGGADFMFRVIHERTALADNLQVCGRQIFMSFSYSGYAMKQCAGRICRLGQKAKEVITHYYVTNSFEKAALAYVLTKLANVRMTLSGIESLNRDEICQLLKLLKQSIREDED